MPTYEFECIQCANKIELIQKVKEDPPVCSCGAGKMKKLISRTSFILKGTGWYKTDYANRK